MPRSLAPALSLLIAATAATATGAQPPPSPPPRPLTLAAALAAAEAHSPRLRAAAAAVEEARGRLRTARTYPHNPAVELEGAERDGADGTSTDRALALSQEIEIAGQRGQRAAAARSALAAAEATHDRRRRELRSAVEQAFAGAVRADALLAVARTDARLTRDLVRFEARRLEAGAGTQIDVNLTRAAAGRAARRLQEATAARAAARARLAELAGLDPAAPPRAVGTLPHRAPPLPPVAELTDRALEARSDLAALRRRAERAERRVALERSLAVPNLRLGAFAAREEGADLMGLRVGIGLPLFDRNRGAVATARAAVSRSAAESAGAELAVRREVAAAHARYRAAAAAVTALDDLVLASLEESVELLRKAVEAGEMSTRDVLLLRRDLVEGQRERIEAAGELWLARAELELASGGADVAADRDERNEEESHVE